MMPRDTIAAISVELEQRARAFERARDPRCVFARAYAEMCRVLANALPYAGFKDPVWVANLQLRFCGYYTHAIREYDGGRLPKGSAWYTVFRASERGRTSVLEELVLGMTAHIVNDLPQALCEVGLTSDSGESRIIDYHVMNDILGQAIERIQLELERRYDPLLGVLDHLAQHNDEILTNYGIRLGRGTAWYNAQRLAEPRLREGTLAAIAKSPEVTMRELIDPPVYSVRFVLRLARRIGRIARRWPSDQRVRITHAPYVSEPNINLDQISAQKL